MSGCNTREENAIELAQEETQLAARQSAIRALNDALRTTFASAAGKVVISKAFRDLSEADRQEAITLVQGFNGFTLQSDPHNEHDFGLVRLSTGPTIMWKIDYFDKDDIDFGSEAPEDASVTQRILTLMIANEY